jgi:integrase
MHCNANHLRKPVALYDPDIILTFRIMMEHRPSFSDEDLKKFSGNPVPLFLKPKARLKRRKIVWFHKQPMGHNTLQNVTKEMAISANIDKKVTNKTGRQVGVTRMEEAKVPLETAMRRTGHRDPKSFYQYVANTNRSLEDKALQRVISGEKQQHGRVVQYQEAHDEEKTRKEMVFFAPTSNFDVVNLNLLCLIQS